MPGFCYCCHASDHVLDDFSKRETGETYPEPVFSTKMDEEEPDAYKDYVLLTLKQDRELIRVGVKRLTSKIDYFNIRKDIPIYEFKKIYSNEMGIPVDDMRFIYADRQLEDLQTPHSINMQDGDTTDFFLRLRG